MRPEIPYTVHFLSIKGNTVGFCSNAPAGPVVRMAVNDAVKDLIAGLGDQGKDPKEVLKGW